MASKVRIYLDWDGSRYLNQGAMRLLEKQALERLLVTPTDTSLASWQRALWIFRQIAYPYSRLTVFRTKRGHNGNAYVQLMKQLRLTSRRGWVRPPARRRVQERLRQAVSPRFLPRIPGGQTRG